MRRTSPNALKRLRSQPSPPLTDTAPTAVGKAKGGEAIGVPLNDDAMAVLRNQKGKHPERVLTYKRRPLGQGSTRSWRNALKRAGIENFRWHDSRHVWATWHA